MAFYVYILASRPNGTLYAGMTDDPVRRIWQPKQGLLPGFTQTHSVTQLVWIEAHETRESAFRRERQIKKWNRAWKIREIENTNPQWKDLYDQIL